ncbi:MAG: galactose oxidase [Gammaproteobacteria bacterium]|nr:galactose oxidase [Gammaproteobacteria bacterium]MDH3372645.1 galactose oxidase [Gammaproteobacteria bacterium]MDH3410373.1 galactose oxidase [Gammaproteobacteria bacterium]MDH3553040.1 galactose oxidase [Gammaproteobacteria bacterium]
MRNLALTLSLILVVAILLDMNKLRMTRTASMPPLPVPVTNNAVASVTAQGREFVVSFAGLGEGKSYEDTHARTFVLDSNAMQWREASPVPGDVGRIAAAAIAVGERAFVFGGYTVADDGSEVSTRWVHAFDPLSGEFEERQPIPVPVDDALAVSYEDRYIYLISGWHDFGNVNLVQRYDAENDSWAQATPTPGHAVFGHAGGIVGNTIVYCDGVAIEPQTGRKRAFVANNECFAGIIDRDEGRSIDWRRLAPHPGRPRYRMAATGSIEHGAVLFVGGSENPYNFDGIGYDGEASSPAAGALMFSLENDSWLEVGIGGPATMDHRGLVPFQRGWLTIGGMLDGQRVTDTVSSLSLEEAGD